MGERASEWGCSPILLLLLCFLTRHFIRFYMPLANNATTGSREAGESGHIST